jgi:predicted CopG family antitoxin
MMATKTLAVSENAYRILESLKAPGESFSDVIVRYYKRGSYHDLAGAWRGVAKEEIESFKRELATMRRRSDEKLGDALKRMGW